MKRSPARLTVASLLGLIACIALNLWMFRLGVLWGILGLNITKHVAIAYLCQILGVDRRPEKPKLNGAPPEHPSAVAKA